MLLFARKRSMRAVETSGSKETSAASAMLLDTGSVRKATATGLPRDLEAESAGRLRIVACLYAFVFFVSDPLTAVLFPEDRAAFFGRVLRWLPATISIATAIGVALVTWSRRIPVRTTLTLGLVFQVVGSFGIATAQYLDVSRYHTDPPWAGLSWVAVWMLSFTVMIPSRPRAALIAALASASAVPVVAGLAMATEGVAHQMPAAHFFFQIVLPYLLVVLVAYVGARVVYRLGTGLSQARDLGSYRLIERLGEGGMGEVWRAQHRLLARPAAVKLIRFDVRGGADLDRQSELRARFEREAQATSSLRSPHTVELYDYGMADNGTFYYVMELLDGYDLQALIERFGPIPPERAVYLLKQVCHSIGEAHGEGLIHRDIKPANVHVCRYGREVDFVKVLDFGLVKPLEAEGQTHVDITAQHVARGTPAFMSPEQVLGTQALDGRSDIYALGCLAYWLVTGHLVFNGRTAMETMVQHTQVRPVAPSRRAPMAIPPSLDDVILACLEKHPDARPVSADDVAARLDAVTVQAPWTTARAGRWWERHHPTGRYATADVSTAAARLVASDVLQGSDA
jgi:serine/threonine-protein kinase